MTQFLASLRSRRGAVVVGIVLAGLGASTSAQGRPAATNAGEISSLNWGIAHEIQSLDPQLSYDGGGQNLIAYSECDALLKLDGSLRLQPQIASSWKQTSPTSYVYKLRTDARFWDGNPVTAADVAFTFNRVLDPKVGSPLQSLTPTVKKAVVSGPNEVTLELKTPDPRTRWLAALPTFQVVEKSFVQKWGKKFGTAPDKMMCSGPFKVVSWTKGATVVLQRVADYWNKAEMPHVAKLTFTTVGDPAAMVAGLRSGQIDGTFDMDGRNATALGSASNLTVKVSQGNQINYISPNLLKGPLKDQRVRQALSDAIDRTGLAFAIHGKYGETLKSAVPPGLSSFQKPLFAANYKALRTPLKPDVSGAKKLVAAAGANGTAVTIGVLASGTNDIVSSAITQAGQAIGLKIVIKKLAPNAYFPENFSGKLPRTYDGLLNFWAADYPDPAADLITPFGSKFSNVEGWLNPQYDALTKRYYGSKAESPQEAKILAQMEKMLVDRTVKIPLYVDPLIQVSRKALGGYRETKMYFYQQFAKMLTSTS
jgi:peptide/nickel transport system substrate-binding protein